MNQLGGSIVQYSHRVWGTLGTSQAILGKVAWLIPAAAAAAMTSSTIFRSGCHAPVLQLFGSFVQF
jgi:hypothetical protein